LHRVHLASDLHLGAPNASDSRERELRFIQWLENAAQGKGRAAAGPATEIHLVGDVFDFWFEYKRAVPKGGVRLLGAIARVADSGIPVHYHAGNHDLWTFGYFEEELGVTLHRAPIVREYDGLRCMIGHGDGIGSGDEGYKRLKNIFTNPFLQKAYRLIHPDIGIALASYLSRNSRAKKGHLDNLIGGREDEWIWQFCREYLTREEIDCFIFGHRHLPLDFEVPGPEGRKPSRYINLGDWIQHFTSARIENGGVHLDRP
jgi:UDP-2,3-diacylglucosamine hydrolase